MDTLSIIDKVNYVYKLCKQMILMLYAVLIFETNDRKISP